MDPGLLAAKLLQDAMAKREAPLPMSTGRELQLIQLQVPRRDLLSLLLVFEMMHIDHN